MNAWKFTGQNGTTYNGFAWPLPHDGQLGEWVDIHKRAEKALTPADLCTGRVLHATDAAHLLDWLDEELYEIEIDEGRGVIVADKIGFRRGRLLRRIEEWNERTARLFACDCAEDVLRYADEDARPTLECAIYVARCYADGEATDKELAAAWAAAWAAAGAAAWAAARGAARAAAWAAAWGAARGAAGAAARAAAWAAGGDKYNGWLMERLGIA